jgi:hypothetical protein
MSNTNNPEDIKRLKSVLDIDRAIIRIVERGYYAGGGLEDNDCFFCSAWSTEDHTEDCPFIVLKKYIENRGMPCNGDETGKEPEE